MDKMKVRISEVEMNDYTAINHVQNSLCV